MNKNLKELLSNEDLLKKIAELERINAANAAKIAELERINAAKKVKKVKNESFLKKVSALKKFLIDNNLSAKKFSELRDILGRDNIFSGEVNIIGFKKDKNGNSQKSGILETITADGKTIFIYGKKYNVFDSVKKEITDKKVFIMRARLDKWNFAR